MDLSTVKPMYVRMSLRIVPAALALLFLLTAAGKLHAADGEIDWSQVKQRLVSDGVDEQLVDSLFSDPRLEVVPKLMRLNMKQPDATPSYKRFLEKESIIATTRFMKKHRKRIERALAGTRVDPAIVVAILQVESSLGQTTGDYPLMNVYATLALLDSDQRDKADPKLWDHVLSDLPREERAAARRTVRERARRKGRWAYRQLKALCLMSDKGFDPFEARGSWAGAYGLPQFLPTSLEAYGRDGNQDGRIDLASIEDAAASIANYLEVHQYRSDQPAKRRKAVWNYNHSDEYVDCVLNLAARVAAESGMGAESWGKSQAVKEQEAGRDTGE